MGVHNDRLHVNGGAYWEGDERAAPRTSRRNRILLVVLFGVAFGMVGFAFLNAKFFNMLCEALGIAQTRSGAANLAVLGDDSIDGRPIDVLFVANVQGQLPVTFRPDNRIVKTRLGATTLNDYHFVNVANRPVYFMPIHNYSPPAANRTGIIELGECFCFEPQMLHPREQKSLPVVFKISPQLDSAVASVTFYYTLFEMTEQEYKTWWSERNLQPSASHGKEAAP